MMGRKFIVWVFLAFVVIAVIFGALYAKVVPGLSSARSEPPAAETLVATWLLHQSVPDSEKSAVNPLKNDAASVAAGRELYKEKCETCHGYDGGGKTTIGGNQYPRPPALRSFAIQATSGRRTFLPRSAMALPVTPACPRGACPTVRSGNS